MKGVLGSVRRLRTWMVLGLLLAALYVVTIFVGCDVEQDDDPPVYYGPPPSDVLDMLDDSIDPEIGDPDVSVLYGPMPVDVVEDKGGASDVEDQEFMPLYGPQPVDIVEDTPEKSDMPRTYYGPQPVDVVEDIPEDEGQPRYYYGPQPTDVVEDTPEADPDSIMVLYGPNPVDSGSSVDAIAEEDVAEDLEPVAFYGPAPVYGPQEGEFE